MKAIVYRRYGGPEVLEYTDVSEPAPKADQVLIQVRAASVNAADYRLMRADPWLARLETGLFKPKKWPILGSDFAGIVAGLGEKVTNFKVGDAVFGDAFLDGRGSFAEYVCVSEGAICQKPEPMSFEEAAAVPLAGITALQGLRDFGKAGSGQRVLIQGAGGGVGLYALQIAKALGAHVTAVCGGKSLELARQLGADRVINYASEDFTRGEERYDAIIAINGYHPIADYKRCLSPGGRYVMIGGDNRQIFEALLRSKWTFWGSGRTASPLSIVGSHRSADLHTLRELILKDQLKSVIDRTFALQDAAEAIRYVEKGHVLGKVILTV